MEIVRKAKYINVLRQKKMTDSQYSQRASNGIGMKSRDTIPVPIVIANHDGEKLRTILRQPTWIDQTITYHMFG